MILVPVLSRALAVHLYTPESVLFEVLMNRDPGTRIDTRGRGGDVMSKPSFVHP